MYEKKGVDPARLCRSLKADQITFDEFLGVDKSKLDKQSQWAFQRGTATVVGSQEAVIELLRKSKIVNSYDSHHRYHHVAHKDQYGYITTGDGTKLIWMLRPGGLGMLVQPDGGAIFLARQ
jgi:hypothetical protein